MKNRCRCRAFISDSDFYSIVPVWCLLGSTDERKRKMRFPQEVAFSFSLVKVTPPPPLFDTVYNEALLFVIEGIVLKKILNNQSTHKTSKKD